MGLHVKPDVMMRKDGGRVVCYHRDDGRLGSWRSDESPVILNPIEAIVLALLDGRKSEAALTEEVSYLTDLPPAESQEMVSGILERHRPLLDPLPGGAPGARRFDPQDFLIRAGEIDLSPERLNVPTNCVWVVTLDCAFRCVYCFADINSSDRPRQSMVGPQDIRRIVDQFQTLQLGTVGLAGGDPFRHPHILEILRLLSQAGYFPEVPTKTPLTGSVLQQIRDLGFPSIQFSLDSPFDHEVLARHLGRVAPDYLARMLHAIQEAGRVGLKVGINAVITRHNVHQISDMVRIFGELGMVYRLGLSQVGPSLYRDCLDLAPARADLEAAEERLAELRADYPHMRVSLGWVPDPLEMSTEERAAWYPSRPRCSAGRWAFTILPDGSMTLCEELYYHPAFLVGNVLETPIAELWNSPTMRSILYPAQSTVHAGPCRDCEQFDECARYRGRCWKRAMRAFPGQAEPQTWPDPYCPKAPLELAQATGNRR